MTVKKSDSHFEKRQKHLQTLAEWQNLLEHFELNDNSFAYIPLLLPNDLWARVCENSLENYLSAKGKNLSKIECETPEDVKNIAVTLLALEIDADTEAIWIVAPIGTGEKFLEKWAQAWREGMARLNQYRNPLREKFPVTLLFVGAEWIQEITRNMAPDLWSIRSTVIRLQPKIRFSELKDENTQAAQSESVFEQGKGIDPEFALKEAMRLRGIKGAELHLADIFVRAAAGFLNKKDYHKTLETIEEAIKIYEKEIAEESDEVYQEGVEISLADALFIKSLALVKLDGFEEEAEKLYRRIIKINPNRSPFYYAFGYLLEKDKNRWAEAEKMFRKAIDIKPDDDESYNHLGSLLSKIQTRQREAEEMYRKAIEINPNQRFAYGNLGNLFIRDESRWKEAEEFYRKSIEINPNYASPYFNFACLRSMSRQEENKREAFEYLKKAIELDASFQEFAKTDADFDFLRDDVRFREIVNGE